MPTLLTRYQLDKTGTNPDNKVIGEVHVLDPQQQYRVAIPTYGAFFTESMQIRDTSNNLLTRGVDYKLVELVQEASLLFGKEICTVILISNQSVSSEIKIDYQVVGGLYSVQTANLDLMFDAYINDNRPVQFENVLNKPFQYNPTAHTNYLQDLYGFENVVNGLERIERALTVSNLPIFDTLIKFIEDNITSFSDVETSVNTKVNEANSLIDNKVNQALLIILNSMNNYTEHNTTHVSMLRSIIDEFLLDLNRRKSEELEQRSIYLNNILALKNQMLEIRDEFSKWLNEKLKVRIPFASDEEVDLMTGGGMAVTHDQVLRMIQASTIEPSTANMSVSAVEAEEGLTISVNITTTLVEDGYTYYWSIVHDTSDTVDFVVDSGSIPIYNNRASFTVTTNVDNFSEGMEYYYIVLRKYSVAGKIVLTSPKLKITDINLYSLTVGTIPETLNEGDPLVVTLTTVDAPNNVTYDWVVEGSQTSLNVNRGTVTISNNTATLSLQVKKNYIADDSTQLRIVFLDALQRRIATTPLIFINDVFTLQPVINELYYTSSCSVNQTTAEGLYITRDNIINKIGILDTSNDEVIVDDRNTYNLSVTNLPTQINEGETVTLTFNTINAPDNTVYNWTLDGDKTTLTRTSGTFTVVNNIANVTITASTNYTTDQDKVIRLFLRDSLNRIIDTTANITIKDVFTLPPVIENIYFETDCAVDLTTAEGLYLTRDNILNSKGVIKTESIDFIDDRNTFGLTSVTPSTVNEGGNLEITLTTINAPDNTVYNWSVDGSQTSLLNNTGTVTIINNTAAISIPVKSNYTVNDNKQLRIFFRSTNGVLVTASDVITVTDVFTPVPVLELETIIIDNICSRDCSTAEGLYLTRDNLRFD